MFTINTGEGKRAQVRTGISTASRSAPAAAMRGDIIDGQNYVE